MACCTAGRRRLLADARRERRQALPLRRQPIRPRAWRRVLPCRPHARGRDRGRRLRPAPRRVPSTWNHRGHLEDRACAGRRHNRIRHSRCHAAFRSYLGRGLPRRAGMHRRCRSTGSTSPPMAWTPTSGSTASAAWPQKPQPLIRGAENEQQFKDRPFQSNAPPRSWSSTTTKMAGSRSMPTPAW